MEIRDKANYFDGELKRLALKGYKKTSTYKRYKIIKETLEMVLK